MTRIKDAMFAPTGITAADYYLTSAEIPCPEVEIYEREPYPPFARVMTRSLVLLNSVFYIRDFHFNGRTTTLRRISDAEYIQKSL